MMGRKQKLIDGDEFDVVTIWRKLLSFCHRAGICKAIKRKMNKRARKEYKKELKDVEILL